MRRTYSFVLQLGSGKCVAGCDIGRLQVRSDVKLESRSAALTLKQNNKREDAATRFRHLLQMYGGSCSYTPQTSESDGCSVYALANFKIPTYASIYKHTFALCQPLYIYIDIHINHLYHRFCK